MELSEIIIHELIKESESNVVELILANELISNNLESNTLITSVSEIYKSDKLL